MTTTKISGTTQLAEWRDPEVVDYQKDSDIHGDDPLQIEQFAHSNFMLRHDEDCIEDFMSSNIGCQQKRTPRTCTTNSQSNKDSKAPALQRGDIKIEKSKFTNKAKAKASKLMKSVVMAAHPH